MTDSQTLSMWVIYEKPRDFPCDFVARRWDMRRSDKDFHATQECHVKPTLEAVRAMLPQDLYRIERSAGDEPHIVEVWM